MLSTYIKMYIMHHQHIRLLHYSGFTTEAPLAASDFISCLSCESLSHINQTTQPYFRRTTEFIALLHKLHLLADLKLLFYF